MSGQESRSKTIEDDDVSFITYSGIWQPRTANAQYSGGNYHLATRKGDTMTIVFDGTWVEVFGAKKPAYGTYNVELDGRLVLSASAGSSVDAFRQPLFSRTNMQDATHILRLVNTGGSFDVDTVAIGSPRAATNSPPNVTNILIGITLGVVGLLCILCTVFLVWRLKRRKDQNRGSFISNTTYVQPHPYEYAPPPYETDSNSMQPGKGGKAGPPPGLPSPPEPVLHHSIATTHASGSDPAIESFAHKSLNRSRGTQSSGHSGSTTSRRSIIIPARRMSVAATPIAPFDTRRVTALYTTQPVIHEYNKRDTIYGKTKLDNRRDLDLLAEDTPLRSTYMQAEIDAPPRTSASKEGTGVATSEMSNARSWAPLTLNQRTVPSLRQPEFAKIAPTPSSSPSHGPPLISSPTETLQSLSTIRFAPYGRSNTMSEAASTRHYSMTTAPISEESSEAGPSPDSTLESVDQIPSWRRKSQRQQRMSLPKPPPESDAIVPMPLAPPPAVGRMGHRRNQSSVTSLRAMGVGNGTSGIKASGSVGHGVKLPNPFDVDLEAGQVRTVEHGKVLVPPSYGQGGRIQSMAGLVGEIPRPVGSGIGELMHRRGQSAGIPVSPFGDDGMLRGRTEALENFGPGRKPQGSRSPPQRLRHIPPPLTLGAMSNFVADPSTSVVATSDSNTPRGQPHTAGGLAYDVIRPQDASTETRALPRLPLPPAQGPPVGKISLLQSAVLNGKASRSEVELVTGLGLELPPGRD